MTGRQQQWQQRERELESAAVLLGVARSMAVGRSGGATKKYRSGTGRRRSAQRRKPPHRPPLG
ncbi:hypothetical protein ACIOKD_32780 [Streptomyces sp. NPDC087844]|uniref:hypothetical protein n=1 Tax=Streptomyces sp. NPDC087844 TaxID=3365805 RepID=UPI0037F69E8F